MGDGLLEKLERVCERFAVPEPWRTLCLTRFEEGRERYGPWNHLNLPGDLLLAERNEEAADLLAFVLLIPWSRAYYSPLTGIEEEGIDEGVDSVIVDGFLDFLRLLSGGENGQPAHAR